MSTLEFLSHLRRLNIKVIADGERLRIQAPEGALTTELRNELTDRKAELLELLQQANLTAQTKVPSIAPVSRDRKIPLSFAQQRLWFLMQLEPENSSYHISNAIKLSGPLDIPALQRSLETLIERHEVLRTTFAAKEGVPEQVVMQHWSFEIPLVDLSAIPKDEQDTEIRRLLREGVRKPFDVSSDLVLRATLLRLRREEHILMLVTHHIASDGWSMDILWRELSTLYTAFHAGQPPSLLELPIQYADFAVWQRNWLQGDILQQQLSYWKSQLHGTPAVLDFPTDRPRPPKQSQQGARLSFVLPIGLMTALKALSQQEGVTLFMMLLTAFKILLYRYTGQEDIPVGSPIANRHKTEIEGLIGFFVNTLVLRTNISGNPTVLELLKRVQNMCLEAYAHQDLPFERLVEELQPERNIAHSPLFQVMFAFQNVPGDSLTLPDLIVSPLKIESETTTFDMTFAVVEEPGGLKGTVAYSTDLFDTTTISRMLGHFQVLLEGIVTNPDQRIAELPLLTEHERHQILVEWNNTSTDYPRHTCIHELFEAQVERTPNSVAVVFKDQQLTYCELNSRANQLAHYLRTHGVGPDVLVGICMERSLEMVVGLLGILKAGGAYVPLDPLFPRERITFMVKDSQALVLLTQQSLASALPHLIPCPSEQNQKTQCVMPIVICLDTDWQTIAQECQETPVVGVTADNLAYVIYTSGSTGTPKGTLIPHKGLLNLIFWHQREFKVTSSDRATQLAGIAFDASVWEIWPYLAAGATLYLMESESLHSPVQLQNWLISKKINISFVPTPLAERLLPLEWAEQSALRIMLIGGDKLHQYPSTPVPFQVVNNYGPTENTVVTTSGRVTTQRDDALSPPIGHPIANTKVYILDRHLHPVPIGVPGELHIGGVGLALGYLNRADLTAEKFIPNPFSDKPGSCLYKTGDFVRYLPDGNIEFLGRIDHQVKIRGFRIELGEIEHALQQHSLVQEALAIVREDQPGDKRLVAYVILKQASSSPIHDFRHFLKQKLPEYMVPSAFVMLDTLPLTPNGKVDRRALPLPDNVRPDLLETFVAPRNSIEKIVANIWTEVLGLEKVGIHDNFFDLGGHSLLAVQVHSKLQEVFEQEISVVDIFQYPTVGAFAQYLHQQQTQHVSPDPKRDGRTQTRLARRASMNQQRRFRQKGREMNSQGEDLHE